MATKRVSILGGLVRRLITARSDPIGRTDQDGGSLMRNVILLMSMSIDGVVAAPENARRLSPGLEDPELSG